MKLSVVVACLAFAAPSKISFEDAGGTSVINFEQATSGATGTFAVGSNGTCTKIDGSTECFHALVADLKTTQDNILHRLNALESQDGLFNTSLSGVLKVLTTISDDINTNANNIETPTCVGRESINIFAGDRGMTCTAGSGTWQNGDVSGGTCGGRANEGSCSMTCIMGSWVLSSTSCVRIYG
jgi:hypothetical protein